MSFYGNISDKSRTDLKFDKIYPNRFTMDAEANNDEIFVGRYVLINYNEGGEDSFKVNTDKYKCLELINGKYSFFTDFTRTIDIDGRGQIHTDSANGLQTNTHIIVKVLAGNHYFNFNLSNLYVKLDKDTKKIVATFSEEVYNNYWNSFEDNNFVEEINRPLLLIENEEISIYNNEELFNSLNLDEAIFKVPSYFKYSTNSEDEYYTCYKESIYRVGREDQVELANFHIDRTVYQEDRGYNSTVWEKVYVDNKYKYIKIADLNSYVPTIDLNVVPPTVTPKTPKFADIEGNNVNYKLDWQPSWGLRVKSAVPQMKISTIQNGEITNEKVNASNVNKMSFSENDFINPNGTIRSDINTNWSTEIYDEETETYKPYILQMNGDKTEGSWTELKENQVINNTGIPAAIYFNKEGFNINESHYASGAFTPDYNRNNYIRIEPSGQSGHVFTDNENDLTVQPDTQEISIMLPAIGDAIAKVWDTVYGVERNQHIEWEEASLTSPIRRGIRMVSKDAPYNIHALNTLAGCINTAHDLIGMIVAETDEDFSQKGVDIDKYSEHYIYFNRKNNTYYQKRPITKLVEVDNIKNQTLIQKLDTTNLIPFNDNNNEDKIFYLESTNRPNGKEYYNYIFDKNYHSDKQYVKINPSEIEDSSLLQLFEKNKYYYQNYNNDNGIWYFADNDFDENVEYYKLTVSEIRDEIYVPGVYYYKMPVYDNDTFYDENDEVPYIYVLDTTVNGLKRYPNKNGYSNSGQVHYDKNYKGKAIIYYRPIQKDSDEQSYIINTSFKEIRYSEEEYGLLKDLLYTMVNGEYVQISSNKNMVEGETYYLKEQILEPGTAVEIDETKSYSFSGIAHFKLRDLNYFKCDFGNEKIQTSSGIYTKEGNNLKPWTMLEIAENILMKKGNQNNSIKFYTIIDFQFEEVYAGIPNVYYKLDAETEYDESYLLNLNAVLDKNLTYYKIGKDEINPVKVFEPYDYYIANKDEDGNIINFELFKETNWNDSIELYETPKEWCIIEDPLHIYKSGTLWNPNIDINILINNGIKFGYQEKDWQMVPLDGFARNLNTLLGLILKVNRIINDSDEYTRDRKTIQGTINTLNDIIDKIYLLYPQELVLTDQFGRIYAPKDSIKHDEYINLELKENKLQVSHALAQKIPTNQLIDEFVPEELDIITLDIVNVDPETGEEKDASNLITDIDNDGSPEEEDYSDIINEYIEFKVPVIVTDEAGHIKTQYSRDGNNIGIQYQTYRIPCIRLVKSVIERMEQRIDALEQNALRLYENGIRYNEGE